MCTNSNAVPMTCACTADKWGVSVFGRCRSQSQGAISLCSRMNSNIQLCECTNPSAAPIPGACVADKWGGSVCGRCGSQHSGALCSSGGVNLCPCQIRQGGPGPCSEAAWRCRLCWYVPLLLSSSSFMYSSCNSCSLPLFHCKSQFSLVPLLSTQHLLLSFPPSLLLLPPFFGLYFLALHLLWGCPALQPSFGSPSIPLLLLPLRPSPYILFILVVQNPSFIDDACDLKLPEACLSHC